MGQHTWFVKRRDLFFKQNELYEKLDSFENNETYLDDMEVDQLNNEIEEIKKQNYTDYHDLFRTGKRNQDKSYLDEIISSREECLEWLEKPENFVTFRNSCHETREQEMFNREQSIIRLNEFWDKYPNGVIYFG